ncbi:MAG: ADP-glyceromanno-heptose 6-epimerase [Bacteroidetes bacterium]|nr:ADP-glyceromanno-heptose 6-epimerase [Bacteroidota bacterium]
MDQQSTIVLTGAAGFIGSCMLQYLNEQGLENIILVDKFTALKKEKNWKHKKYKYLVDRDLLLEWLSEKNKNIAIDLFIHLGARADTTEFDYNIHKELNEEYSQDVWNYCTANDIPLIYASSAVTYGNGDLGYHDDDKLLNDLQPLNPYGVSKNEFDKWAIRQLNAPPLWTGLKFFTVYGPNEYHKEKLASVVLHAFRQIDEHGFVKLYKSCKQGFDDGGQLRDFVYVKDIIQVIGWLSSSMLEKTWQQSNNGIYNVGTGKARSFNDLATATFTALDKTCNITYIDLPAEMINTYQYFTEASIVKLQHAGYNKPFTSLEDGVNDYVRNYLLKKEYY